MKIIGLFSFIAFSLPTFAADIVCEKQISPMQIEYTVVDLWPTFQAQSITRQCVGNGGMQLCIDQGRETIADANQLCGYRVNVRWECQTREWYDGRNNRFVDTRCPNRGISSRMQIRPNGDGKMTCMRGNFAEKTWRLGTCS